MQTTMMLPVGVLLHSGKYRVMRYLSSGGFGNTYVVEKTKNGEILAMKEFFMRGLNERGKDSKTISVSNSVNEQTFAHQKEKFKKEARRLAQFNHRNLVKVHGLFEENGTAYYLMDFVDGASLSAMIAQNGKAFTETEVFRILFQVLDALDEIHKKKMWHLDLKPGNILMDKSGRVVLIDFGASKQMVNDPSNSNLYTTTSISYTPGYAPPEQADQDLDLIGPWTDFYALGATLFFLLTRKKPPTLSQIQEKGIEEMAPKMSPPMSGLIKWLMSPGRAKRPQSVGEIWSYLRRFDIVPLEEETTVIADEETILSNPVEDKKPPVIENVNDGKTGSSRLKNVAMIIAVVILSLLVAVFLFNHLNKNESEVVVAEEDVVIEPTVEIVTIDLMQMVEAKDEAGVINYLDRLKTMAEDRLIAGDNNGYFNIIYIIKTVWETNKDRIIESIPALTEMMEAYITPKAELKDAFNAFVADAAMSQVETVKDAAKDAAAPDAAGAESYDAWNDDFFNEGFVYDKNK